MLSVRMNRKDFKDSLCSDPIFLNHYSKLEVASEKLFYDVSPATLNDLRSVCDNFKTPSLSILFRFVVPPLGVHLSTSDDVSLIIFKCFSTLLAKSEISDLETFLFVYITLIGRLQDTRSPELVRECSEELKLEFVNCISLLFKNSSREVLQQFISRKYYSKLSIAIFLCAQIAKNEKYITLKVKALKCLMVVTLVSDELHYHEDFKEGLTNVLMLMIPGISANCLGILESADTQNHQPTVLAIRLWSRVVATVLSIQVESSTVFRLENNSNLNGNTNSKKKPTNPIEFMNSLKKIQVDKKWLTEADNNISDITKIFVTCQSHSHWRVRLELATASYLLLSKCGVNIPKSTGYLSEALIYLSQDEENKVSEYCKKCIVDLSKDFEKISEKNLVDIVEENFFSLLTRFPRIIRGKDITLIEHELTLLCGYLEILGHKHVPAVLRSCQHLDRFLHCLLTCTTPNYDYIMLQEVALRGVSEDSNSIKTEWRHLQYCETKRSETLLMTLCSYLLEYAEIEMLLNRLLDSFNSDPTNKNNILLLLIFLFSSGPPEKFHSHSSLLKDIINTLIEPSLWEMPDDNITGPIATHHRQHYFIQISLLVDLIGCIAEAAGPSMFLPLLLQCLYPVLESAGHPLPLISYAGQFSLQKLAKLYEEGKVSSLIAKNVDYLAHHVMLKLRQVHRNPRILYILSAIMKHSSIEALPSLHEIINDVLIQSRDMFQDVNIRAFLEVFYSYLTCIKKWTISINEPVKERRSMKKTSLVSELLDYKDTLEATDLEKYDDSSQDLFPNNGEVVEAENINEQKDEEKELPDHIKLTRDILHRSLHFLPKNDISRQILILEIMKEGTEILSGWESVFFPVVHKIWSPLVERFKTSTDPLLLQRSFSLLMVLAENAKDFIQSRTIKEVLPCLNKVLIDERENEKKKSLEAYKFTQIYKLQLLLLSGLGKLCLDLEAEPFQIYPVLEAVSHYLNSKQPTQLREACVQLFKEIHSEYPDLVWLHFLSINPNSLECNSPIKGLLDYKFETSDFLNGELSSEAAQLFSSVL